MSKELQNVFVRLPELASVTGSPSVTLPRVPPLRKQLGKTAVIGVIIVVVFFGILGTWAATAPLSGAAIAAGVVSPQGSRQTVQHLEGGIIRELRVREGQPVRVGDVLIVLQDLKPQADLGQLMAQLRYLAATEARLDAERTGSDTILFTHPSLADKSNPEVRDSIEQQINQFVTRRGSDESRRGILSQRVAQLEQQITGAERQLEGVRRQNALIREEIVAVKELFEKGYEKKPRLLALQRAEAELLGTEGELLSRIARAREGIGEARLQILAVRADRAEKIDDELADVQGKRMEVEKRIEELRDRLVRTEIVAPATGTVLNLKFKTPGGVIRPGDAVLDIVPTEDELVINARLSPNDIDDVHAGLSAYVTFPSLPQRTLMRVSGLVQRVSADALEDPKTGERYYSVQIKVDPDELKEHAPNVHLTPGMPARVFITTAERTLLNYLVQPLLQVVEGGLREH
jgi:HlyD family type I secretion membrane fusion protein